MGSGTGPILSGIAGDHLRVDPLDPLDLLTEAVAHGDCEPGVAVVRLVPFRAPFECASIVPHLVFQAHDLVFKGCDDGLVEDLPLPDG